MNGGVITAQERQEFEEFKHMKRVAEARSVISRLELSFERPAHERAALRAAVNDAVRLRLGGICVAPCLVKQCASLRGEGCTAAVVACLSWWGGTDTADVKVRQIKRAVRDGASAAEVTAPVPAVKEGGWNYIRRELKKLVRAARRISFRLNVEAPLLTEQELSKLCSLACECGVPCVRTASGAFGSGADEQDLEVIRCAVKERAHIKADGAEMPGRVAALFEHGADIVSSSDAVALARAVLAAADG